jgi:RNA polymerase sigma-70 factor (ECF subfamily)
MTARTTAATGPDELQLALEDDRAFEAWHRRTLPRVYSYLLSRCAGDAALAEELTQQTFIAAIEQRSRFDGRSDVVTWLCAIARHKLADHFRSLEREERRRLHLEIRRIDVGKEIGAGNAVEDRAVIADALRSLPASQRAVIAFVVLDDLSVADAARLLGKSRSATESLLFRARENFRRAYTGEVGS